MTVKELLEAVDTTELKRVKRIVICKPNNILLSISPVAIHTKYNSNSGDRVLFFKIKNGSLTLNIENIESIERYNRWKTDGLRFNILLKE